MKVLITGLLRVLFLGLLAQQSPAQPIYLFNPIGVGGDFYPTVSWGQFLGARFELATPVTLESVGMEFRNASGTFFAAVVPLSSMTDLPNGNPAAGIPFNAGEVLASRVFEVDVGSTPQMVATSFPLNLSPGVYGIVFGSGLFGADGWGQSVGYAKVPGSSSFFWSSEPWRWQDAQVFPPEAYAQNNIMIVLAPEPGGMALMALGLSGWICLRRRAGQWGSLGGSESES
jgi:hypothetical protein